MALENKLLNIFEILQSEAPTNLFCFSERLASQSPLDSPSQCPFPRHLPSVAASLLPHCHSFPLLTVCYLITSPTQFKSSEGCEASPCFLWAELDLLWALLALCVDLSEVEHFGLFSLLYNSILIGYDFLAYNRCSRNCMKISTKSYVRK